MIHSRFLHTSHSLHLTQQPWPQVRRVIFLTSSIRTALHCHPHHQPTPHHPPSTTLPPTPPPCPLVHAPPPSNARIPLEPHPPSLNPPPHRRFQIVMLLVPQAKARETADMRPVSSRHRSAKGIHPRLLEMHFPSFLFCATAPVLIRFLTMLLMLLFQV